MAIPSVRAKSMALPMTTASIVDSPPSFCVDFSKSTCLSSFPRPGRYVVDVVEVYGVEVEVDTLRSLGNVPELPFTSVVEVVVVEAEDNRVDFRVVVEGIVTPVEEEVRYGVVVLEEVEDVDAGFKGGVP